MPTLHQIGISTPTREKLAGIKRPHPDDETSNTKASSFVPIRTASSLLSRNPHQLCRLLDVSLDNLKTIRAGVADALVADETTGHSGVAEIIDVVGGRLAADFMTDANNSERDNDGKSNGSFHPALRPPQLIVGSISALDLAAHYLWIGSTLQHVPTGSRGLDQLIGAGISLNMNLSYPFDISPRNDHKNIDGVPFGFVTEVSGPPSSGKTQFCLSVISHALQMQSKVIYITSGNALSISRRLVSLCAERACRSESGEANGGMNDAEIKEVALKQMQNISLVSCSDGHTLLSLLSKIEQQELRSNENDEAKSSLLVIDCMSAIIGHHLSNLTSGAALVSQIGLTLRRMARSLDERFTDRAESSTQAPHRFGVIIANGTVANWSETSDKNNSKPAMGRYCHVSDIGLWMEEEPQDEGLVIHDFYQDGSVGLHRGNKKVVRATLMNHWAKKCGGFARFVVRTGGIYDA